VAKTEITSTTDIDAGRMPEVALWDRFLSKHLAVPRKEEFKHLAGFSESSSPVNCFHDFTDRHLKLFRMMEI
jgi:hypothetical protein